MRVIASVTSVSRVDVRGPCAATGRHAPAWPRARVCRTARLDRRWRSGAWRGAVGARERVHTARAARHVAQQRQGRWGGRKGRSARPRARKATPSEGGQRACPCTARAAARGLTTNTSRRHHAAVAAGLHRLEHGPAGVASAPHRHAALAGPHRLRPLALRVHAPLALGPPGQAQALARVGQSARPVAQALGGEGGAVGAGVVRHLTGVWGGGWGGPGWPGTAARGGHTPAPSPHASHSPSP